MAELVNKLHLKQGDKVYDCICYTTVNEATPTTISGGKCWEIKNNNTVCYLGLWPVSEKASNYSTPLKIRKDGTEFFVQTKVVNNFRVTITQSANQTITVNCNGQNYTQSFDAPAGSKYTVTVTPVTGYTAGAPSSASGYVNSAITITASPASKAKYLVTVTQSAHQTIKVVCNGTTYTSNFTANYGDTWTATVTPEEFYIAGKLNASSGTIKGPVTISASAATIVKHTVSVTQPENGRIEVNGKVGTSFAFNHGTSVKIEAFANEGFIVEGLYVQDA